VDETMNIQVDVFFHSDEKQDEVLAELAKISQFLKVMRRIEMITMQDIIAAGEAQKTVINSGIAALDKLFAKFQEVIVSNGTEAEKQAVLDQMNNSKQDIMNAVVRDTVAENEPQVPLV
jgi:hypothetical protein